MIDIMTSNYFILLLLFVLAYSSAKFSKELLAKNCLLSCGKQKSATCKRLAENCELTPKCSRLAKSSRIDMEEKQFVVHFHNKYRNQMALGLYNDLVATDMLEIIWNNELEHIAVCSANACETPANNKSGNNMTCLKTLDNDSIGQNVAYLDKEHLCRGRMVAIQIAIEMWFNGSTIFNTAADEVDRYSGVESKVSGYYIQTIWAKTAKIGCALLLYRDTSPGSTKSYFLCNYAMAGNIPGAKIYTRGKQPCSQCPTIYNKKSVCDTTIYKALCLLQPPRWNFRESGVSNTLSYRYGPTFIFTVYMIVTFAMYFLKQRIYV